MVRVLKHGRAPELAIQEARRKHCDVCASFESTSLGKLHEVSEMFEHRVSRHSFPDDYTTVVGNDGTGSETSISRRLAAVDT